MSFCPYCSVCVLTACISVISLWYLMMVLFSFSFSALSSSCSFLFSFSFLCTSVPVPLWPPRTVSLLFITSASLLTAWEVKKKTKHRDGSFYRDPLEINLNSVSAAGISMLLQHRFSKTCFTSRWFCPEFNTSLQLSIILNNRWCDITDVWGEKKKLRVYKKLPGFPDLCGQPDTHLNF